MHWFILVLLPVGFECHVVKIVCFLLLEEVIENKAYCGACRNVHIVVHSAALRTFNCKSALRSKWRGMKPVSIYSWLLSFVLVS